MNPLEDDLLCLDLGLCFPFVVRYRPFSRSCCLPRTNLESRIGLLPFLCANCLLSSHCIFHLNTPKLVRVQLVQPKSISLRGHHVGYQRYNPERVLLGPTSISMSVYAVILDICPD